MSYIDKFTSTKTTALKTKWNEINEVMLTHLEGVCPDHIFKHRRPAESNSEYALTYRKNNFKPTTKSPFDKAIAAVTEISEAANLAISGLLDETPTDLDVQYQDELISFQEFTTSRITRIRELDANGLVVIYPHPVVETKYTTDLNAQFDVELRIKFINSKDIESLTDTLIVPIGEWEYKDKETKPYKLIINKQQTALSIPQQDGSTVKYVEYPIYENNLTFSPIIRVSKNSFNSHLGKYSLPYFWGAAAWGDKFYGEDTDFDIKMARFTYPHTIKMALDCAMPHEKLNGVFVDPMSKVPCKMCKGTGKVHVEESPMGATYIKKEDMLSEGGSVIPAISFVEPGQAGVDTSMKVLDKYYDFMCVELGLMKQNLTSQSGESKSYDEKTRISMYSNMVYDNVRVHELMLNVLQEYAYNFRMTNIQTVKVEVIGELNIKTNEELIQELIGSGNAHPAIKVALTKKILLKQLGDNDLNRRIVNLAAMYDKLFMYGSNDLAAARAQLGNKITEKDIMVHNSVIDLIQLFITDPSVTDEAIIAKLDTYYSKYATANTLA